MTPENEARERQLERMREALDEKNEAAREQSESQSFMKPERPQDEQSIRAKGTKHKKVTAENWNQ